MFALILAGGTGTRLWPGSRTSLPKQLLPLIGNHTMMEATVKRVLPLMPHDYIFVATNRDYGPLIKEKVPEIPQRNIIEEPSGKNTAPGIGLAALHMHKLDPEAVMASLHADHFIRDEEGFRQALLAAEKVANQGYLVTLGITPNKAETGYGYIHRGDSLGEYNGHQVYQVERFLEKPDLSTAEKLAASGEHYWNSGIFIWQLSTLLEAFRRHMPEFARQLDQLSEALDADESISPIWQDIRPQSIDEGIMEQAKKVAVVPVDFGWNDVGSWAALHEINQPDEHGNVVLNAEHINFDTRGSLIDSTGRVVATIGLEDIVIVDTDDALLVCAKDRVQDIKQVVNWLEEQGRTELL